MTRERVLVLDGSQRSALAVTRSLGRRGIHVVVADETPDCLAAASRYCAARARYASPMTEPDRFLEDVADLVGRHEVSVLMPATDATTELILHHRDRFSAVTAHLPSLEAYEAVTDKTRLIGLAEELGVAVPRSVLAIGDDEQLPSACESVGFPVVLKPARSRLWSANRRIAGPVRTAESVQEAMDIVRREEAFQVAPYLVQAFVRGTGHGVFALYDHGTPVGFFAHRRLRERPPTGGVSVLCESTALELAAVRTARRILDAVRWHGVAMVEFRRSAEGVPYLIEVNGRFWGSLQLAIDAGVDFPLAAYRQARGETVEPWAGYRVGVRSRWLVGDLEALYLSGRRMRAPRDLWAVCGQAWRFLLGSPGKTRHDVNRWGDPNPFLTEMRHLVLGGHR